VQVPHRTKKTQNSSTVTDEGKKKAYVNILQKQIWEWQQAACHGLAWLEARCPPKPVYHSPPQLDRGEECNKKLLGRDKDGERSLTSYRDGQNRLNLGKLV